MPDTGVYAFSIRKTRAWRGKTQGISNVYHYFLTTPTTAALENVLTALATAEKPIHATSVNYVEGRAWGPVTPSGSGGRMEAVVTLTGTGSATATANMYLECALLIVWPLGRYGAKNRPQFMRKWLHTCSLAAATGSDLTGNGTLNPLSTAGTTYRDAVTNLTPTGGGPSLPMQTASGHTPISPGFLYQYLEHRQFGR